MRSFRLATSVRPKLWFLFRSPSRRRVSDTIQNPKSKIQNDPDPGVQYLTHVRGWHKKNPAHEARIISSARSAPISRVTSSRKAVGVSERGWPALGWPRAPDPGGARRPGRSLARIGEAQAPALAVIDQETNPLALRIEDIDISSARPSGRPRPCLPPRFHRSHPAALSLPWCTGVFSTPRPPARPVCLPSPRSPSWVILTRLSYYI